MWSGVGKAEGLDLDVWVQYKETTDATLVEGGKSLFAGPDNRLLNFLIKRF